MYKPDVDPIGSKHVAIIYKQILFFVLEHYCQAAECISSTWHYHTSKHVLLFQQTRRIFPQDSHLHQRHCESLIMQVTL
jgi:hypothetical protein